MSSLESSAPDWRAIDAFLMGQASQAQEALVRRWVAADPRNPELLESMRAALTPRMASDIDVDGAWGLVAKRAGVGAPRELVRPLTAPRVIRSRFAASRTIWITALAAGVVIAATLGIRTLANNERSVMEVATRYGERLTKTLDDGSTVTLNSESRVRYSRGPRGRRVDLDGEAVFRVAHDARRPFQVFARGAVATDIGTEFNVRAYSENRRVDVAVTEGSVSLRREAAPGDSVVLSAGMVGHMDSTGDVAIDPSLRSAQMTAWLDGTLVFNATPLADVAADLRRRFGVTLRWSDSTLGARRLTTTLRDETLTQALDAISLALGVEYQRRGDTIIVTPRR
jgi:transmembrane sensor